MGSPGPPGDVTVREAGPGDAAAVARVHVESWRGAYADLLPRAVLDGLSVERRAVGWARTLDPSSPDRVVVAERDDRIVGFAHVGPHHDSDLDTHVGALSALYVEPGRWGRVLSPAIVYIVGYGPLLCAVTFNSYVKELRGAAMTWDKTEKSGKVAMPT